ncbi:ADP-dependent NAD(P)H-hydrate dehydratase [Adlercreutzia sp. ZJ141]|uniref:ADP-dependent NAD(P)H-hydrate dehydratase n=1 Tax=Adlercreutzia sp. ZJ141 TaxID=2709406 RepID=UPI0013EDA982|nr:ADP/ATP-dependent (S)-NAD(P)H-hydrate dehydratase [Adlercreutzia sp. ZJ141]
MSESFEFVSTLPLIPWPAADANKYTRGKLTVVGGSAAYPGAAGLAALAAQRLGAGYVEVVCAPESVDIVRSCGLSLVVRSWDHWPCTRITPSSAGKPVAYVVGPGFDADDAASARLLAFVLSMAQAPVLIDGGAIGCLASQDCRGLLQRRAEAGLDTVITPHGGEAARLAVCVGVAQPPRVFSRAEASSLQTGACTKLVASAKLAKPAEPRRSYRADLAAYACDLAAASRAVVVLKGPDTYVSDGVSTQCVSDGTSALAKAGTGDVLAGIIGAYLAQGGPVFESAVSGVMMHARAGRIAEQRLTSVCVVPEDVIASIPDAVRSFDQC